MTRMTFLGLAMFVAFVSAQPANDAPVLELFEDDLNSVVRELTDSDDGVSTIERDVRDAYSGFRALRVVGQQRYRDRVPGWSYPIVEKPGPGQYRYLRFAWKKVGGTGMMLQLCNAGTNWGQRYVAGKNVMGWDAVSVADKIPEEWVVVTRDLFKDFGEFTVSGLACTPFDGSAGLIDHVYLGRSVADLDKVTRQGLGAETLPRQLTADELGKLWDEMVNEDEGKAYRAARSFAAADKAVAVLADRIKPAVLSDEDKLIARLIAQLDDDNFDVRENASKKLPTMGVAAIREVRRAREKPPSLEAERRMDRILAEAGKGEKSWSSEQIRFLRAVHVLERAGTSESRKLLEKLAEGAKESDLTQAVKAALARLAKRG